MGNVMYPIGMLQAYFSDCVTKVALYGFMVALPFYLISLALLFVGRMRSERISSNIFHRAFDFCESTSVGRVIGGASLFSPTIIILIGSLIWCPSNLLDALLISTLPWMLISLTSLIEFRYHRKI